MGSVFEEFRKDAAVTSGAIVARLLENHGDYAPKNRGLLDLEAIAFASRSEPITHWLAEVKPLFDDDRSSELHGRLLILGLAMLDPPLSDLLAKGGFLGALSSEIREGFTNLLTPAGLTAWQATTSVPDAVRTWSDQPAEIDLLARKALAESLAIRLRRNHDEQASMKPPASFMLHVNGPWGSGKTTLLGFLGRALKGEKWVVVNFNAWQHQRMGQPWWWLLDSLYRQGRQQVGWVAAARLAVVERVWRSTMHRGRDLVTGGLVLVVLIAALIYRPQLTEWVRSLAPEQLDTAGTIAKAVAAILSLATALAGALVGLAFRGPAHPDRTLLQTSRDPLGALRNHFSVLIRLIRRPVAIFVDDLDRCQNSYVVEVLDGIQTLFRDEPVSYVVAADRRWLRTSYETSYQPYVATVQDAGQPLGYLFLDKVFQLSASVPRLTPDVMKEYGRHLLRMKDGAGNAEDSDSVRTKARTRVEALRTEQDLINETERPTGDPVYDRTLREEAVKRLAAAEVENHTKHVLLEFLPLLDPNPRAMKRFVNAYGVQRAVAMLAGINIDRRRLALWTVVSLRWPLLAEYLERRPSMVRQFGSAQLPEDLDPILRPLFRDDDVVATFKGVGAEIGLDESAISACASLRGPRSPAALEKGAAIS